MQPQSILEEAATPCRMQLCVASNKILVQGSTVHVYGLRQEVRLTLLPRQQARLLALPQAAWRQLLNPQHSQEVLRVLTGALSQLARPFG